MQVMQGYSVSRYVHVTTPVRTERRAYNSQQSSMATGVCARRPTQDSTANTMWSPSVRLAGTVTLSVVPVTVPLTGALTPTVTVLAAASVRYVALVGWIKCGLSRKLIALTKMALLSFVVLAR